jgi:peptide/nickel transport system substrate-binding protein
MRTIGDVIQNPFEIVRAIRAYGRGKFPCRAIAATTGRPASALGGDLFPYSLRQSNQNFVRACFGPSLWSLTWQEYRAGFWRGTRGEIAWAMIWSLIRTAAFVIGFLLPLVSPRNVRADEAPPGAYALAMHGEPALPEGFAHLPYASSNARRGGRLTLAYLGGFDSLNPFNVKALTTAQGLNGNVYQTLMFRSADEPFTLYGLIAQRVETDAARDYVIFHLDPRAHFSDGQPITSADVLFSFTLLKSKGRPPVRAAYALVKSAVAPDALTVKFDLTGANDREAPLMLALMPVLSRGHVDAEHFEDQTLAIPVGSGPYEVTEVVPGRQLTLRRDPHYWARDLSVMKGLYNFEEIRIDYYRDAGAMFEAFKAGLYDVRIEDDAARWNSAYDFPAVREGRIVVASVRNGRPKGVNGFAFNTRRPIFAQRAVREALASLFDFEWINAHLYAGAYRRSRGFFDDSELSSLDRPASKEERDLLRPFPGAVDEAVMEGRGSQLLDDGSGRDRALARRALEELRTAGLTLLDGVLQDRNGLRFQFEILVKNRAEERLALAYSQSLARIGVAASVRLVDETQFQRRRDKFDFDMMIGSWLASPSPGGEQRGRWGSAAADQEGSFNLSGLRSPAVDAMIAALVAAQSRNDFVAAARALDRALISGVNIVPLFYAADQWVAYSSKIAKPEQDPLFGVALETWWRRDP